MVRLIKKVICPLCFLFSLLLFLFLTSPKETLAADPCDDFSPKRALLTDPNIQVTIIDKNIFEYGNYIVPMETSGALGMRAWFDLDFTKERGKITATIPTPSRFLWKPKEYRIMVREPGLAGYVEYCEVSITLDLPSCGEIIVNPTSPYINEPFTVTMIDSNLWNLVTHHAVARFKIGNLPYVDYMDTFDWATKTYKVTNGLDKIGYWTVEVAFTYCDDPWGWCEPPVSRFTNVCPSKSFRVCGRDDTACRTEPTPAPPGPDDINKICKREPSCTTCFGDGNVWTALGCIPINDTNDFVGWIFKWLIYIGSGIAFLLMVFGAIQILTSAGNPEKIKAGKELITSALSGLLFIILSLFILRLIGVDILHIPGLSTLSQ